MNSTPITLVVTLVTVAVAAAVVGIIHQLPFEEIHPLESLLIDAAFLAVPVAGAVIHLRVGTSSPGWASTHT